MLLVCYEFGDFSATGNLRHTGILFVIYTSLINVGPVTVAERSNAYIVFARSEAGIVGSNPKQGMNVWCVYVFILCLCCPSCDELITRPRSPTVCKRIMKLKSRGQGPRGL
jgi:hypothetical protein